MLFHSTVRKELSRSFGATLVVLITVVMSMMLIRTLGQASRGSVNPQDVMMVMGYSVLGHLPTILTLSLFISITASLSRMYQDSEMVIWFSSGKGLMGFVSPVFRFAWPVLLITAVLALLVWPWSNQQTQELKDRYEKRGDLERIAPGQFQENAAGSRVFFIEKSSDSGGLDAGRNVFISATERGKQSITSARSGQVETVNDDRFLVLGNGQRLEKQTDRPEIKISEFEEYTTRISTNGSLGGESTPAKSINTLQLINQPSRVNLAELAWRLGLGLAAFNLALLALGLASGNPRAGRNSNLLLALFAYVVYYNFLNLGYGWISNGKAGFVDYIFVVHGGVFVLALSLLALRHLRWSWRDLLPRRAALHSGPAAALSAPKEAA